jgi:protein-tyrosine phosphatase
MGLDYTAGCINFRDVGEFVNWLSGENILPAHKLLRGGTTDFVTDICEIGSPGTIINLRQGPDRNDFGVAHLHFPLENKVEKYHTERKEVRRWLNEIVKRFEREDLQYPVLIHCLSGKDRTGIVVAALLLIAGVRPEIIIQEYLLSEGAVSEALIRTALQGMHQPNYFNRVDSNKVKSNLLRA